MRGYPLKNKEKLRAQWSPKITKLRAPGKLRPQALRKRLVPLGRSRCNPLGSRNLVKHPVDFVGVEAGVGVDGGEAEADGAGEVAVVAEAVAAGVAAV